MQWLTLNAQFCDMVNTPSDKQPKHLHTRGAHGGSSGRIYHKPSKRWKQQTRAEPLQFPMEVMQRKVDNYYSNDQG